MSLPITTVRELRAEALYRRLTRDDKPVGLTALCRGRQGHDWTDKQTDDAINDLVEEGRAHLVFTGLEGLCPAIKAVAE